jgi:hypothetical protein
MGPIDGEVINALHIETWPSIERFRNDAGKLDLGIPSNHHHADPDIIATAYVDDPEIVDVGEETANLSPVRPLGEPKRSGNEDPTNCHHGRACSEC